MNSNGEDDQIVLKINGQKYEGWTDMEIETGLKECSSVITMPVSERWAGKTPPTPWQINRYDKVTVSIGDDLILTGYVDAYNPSYSADDHNVRITVQSKTCDLVDCMPEVAGGSFAGSKLDAIARTICGKLGIDVVVEADVGDPFPDATMEKTETAFTFLERLARFRAVLLTDNEKGDLVITIAGKGGASSGALIQGENILAASATLNAHNLFQQYVVLSQAPLAYDGQEVHTDWQGEYTDPNCPRYRRFVEMAEDPLSVDQANDRAKWRARHNLAEATQASVSVQGFRQPDGSLWKKNQTVPVNSAWLGLDRTLLIGGIKFSMSNAGGRQTHLSVAPPELFTLEPAKGSAGNSAHQWTGDLKKG